MGQQAAGSRRPWLPPLSLAQPLLTTQPCEADQGPTEERPWETAHATRPPATCGSVWVPGSGEGSALHWLGASYLRANKGRGRHPHPLVGETLLPPAGPTLESLFRASCSFPLPPETARERARLEGGHLPGTAVGQKCDWRRRKRPSGTLRAGTLQCHHISLSPRRHSPLALSFSPLARVEESWDTSTVSLCPKPIPSPT